jgi:hypothetical protein
MNQLHYNTRLLRGLAGTTCYGAAFICLQEVLHVQLVDILNGLNDLAIKETRRSSQWACLGAH